MHELRALFEQALTPSYSLQAIIQATDALMEDQKHFTGPIDSWLSSFTLWAASSGEFR